MSHPKRAVRAVHDERTIRVYQAFSPAIADAAVRAQRFVPPFRRGRMTWVKPSFTWMAYRSGWGHKVDQERVLAIDLTREGFEWALAHACVTPYDHELHGSDAEWREALKTSPVRIQWDPERDLHLRELPHRSIQVGLSGEAVDRYVDAWTVRIEDVTASFHAVERCVLEGRLDEAKELAPNETSYPLPAALAAHIAASG
ncbi:MAG: DUF4291 domain-containing protein [Polyangiales bacterium]